MTDRASDHSVHRPPTVWVVCPVYCDVPAFTTLAERVRAELAGDERIGGLRFIVMDDTAGGDPEVIQLENEGDVEVLTPPFNLGHQRGLVFAVRTVLPRVREDDVIVTMDADGEDRPEDVPKLLDPLLASADGVRLVLARRTQRRESRSFRAFYAVFKVLFRLLTGTQIVTGNFAAYRGVWARRRLRHPHFNLSYSSTLATVDGGALHVPCPRGERYAGRSRMGFAGLIIHGVRMLMPFLDRVAVRSLLTFTAVVVLCGLLAATTVAVRLFTDLAVPGWATSVLLLLLLLSFVALGNFVVLFAVFSQSQGISLSNVEGVHHELAGEPPAGTTQRD